MAKAVNTSAITFPVVTARGADATHWGIWDALTGGNFLYGGVNTDDTAALELGDNFRFSAGMLEIEQVQSAAARITERGAQRAIRGMITGTLYVSAHSSNPGITGAGEITANGMTRVAISAAGWTVT